MRAGGGLEEGKREGGESVREEAGEEKGGEEGKGGRRAGKRADMAHLHTPAANAARRKIGMTWGEEQMATQTDNGQNPGLARRAGRY